MLCMAGFMTVSGPTNAQDEPTYRPRTLLDMLFRRGTLVEQPAVRRPIVRRAKVKKSSKARQPAGDVVRVEEPEALPKIDDSRVVLVIGDFMADGLSEGLASAYSQNPNIKIIGRTNGSSGF